MVSRIGLLFLYFLQALIPALALPVERSASDRPFCSQNAQNVIDIITNRGHQMDIVGADEDFLDFSSKWMTNDGAPNKEKNKDLWLLPAIDDDEELNEARMKKRRLDRDDDQYYRKPACKMERTYQKRFDKFPYVKPSVTCTKNIAFGTLEFECMKVVEERPILKISKGCSNFDTYHHETWVHSTELVVTGCQAVLLFQKT